MLCPGLVARGRDAGLFGSTLNPDKMTTTRAYIDPDDSSRSPGIITAVPAAPILVVELYVPHTVLKMLLY